MIYSLLASSEYSDMTITCGESTYKVHKAIVCSRSEFFRRAERFPGGEVRSSSMSFCIALISRQEATRHVVDLHEDEAQIIKLLIQYLYEGEYDPKMSRDEAGQISCGNPVVIETKNAKYNYDFPHTCTDGCPSPHHRVCPHHSCGPYSCKDSCQNFVCTTCCAYKDNKADHMLLHAKMYEIGEKYVVHGLKQLAQDKFERSCTMHWHTPHFAIATHHVFSSTVEDDKGLRDIAVKTISDHIAILNNPEVEALLDEFNGLAAGLLREKAAEIGWNAKSA